MLRPHDATQGVFTSTPFVEAVDAELAALVTTIADLVEEQKRLTPRIYVLRSQWNTLVAYRRTLALQDAGQEDTP